MYLLVSELYILILKRTLPLAFIPFFLSLFLLHSFPILFSSFKFCSMIVYFALVFRNSALFCFTWFVPKVSVLIFLCTNWKRSTSLMYIGTLVVTLAACPYLFQQDWLSQSCATAVCIRSCFLTSLRLRCRKISNNGTLSNFV